ncbi:MAG: hypothetical protein ACUVX9_12760 [Anaerolineae bacterium]
MPAIAAVDLVKTYRYHRKEPRRPASLRALFQREMLGTRAVDGVSLAIQPGEVMPVDLGTTFAAQALLGALDDRLVLLGVSRALLMPLGPWLARSASDLIQGVANLPAIACPQGAGGRLRLVRRPDLLPRIPQLVAREELNAAEVTDILGPRPTPTL